MPKGLPQISWGSTLPVWEGGKLTRQRSFPLLLSCCSGARHWRGERKRKRPRKCCCQVCHAPSSGTPVDFAATCSIVVVVIITITITILIIHRIASRRGGREGERERGRGRGRRGGGTLHLSCLSKLTKERALPCASSGRGRLAQGEEEILTARGSPAEGSTRALAAPGEKGGG